MLKEQLKEFADNLTSEDQAELSAYLRKKDQEAYDQEGLEIARRRSDEMKSGKVQGISIDELFKRVNARRQKS